MPTNQTIMHKTIRGVFDSEVIVSVLVDVDEGYRRDNAMQVCF